MNQLSDAVHLPCVISTTLMNTRNLENRIGLAPDGVRDSSPFLIVACDFQPSIEIGARRITACTFDLAAHGIPSIVVSAFGNVGPSMASMPACVRPVWVPKREPVFLKKLAVAKRAIRRLFRSTVQQDGTLPPIAPPAQSIEPLVTSPSLLVRLAILIDVEKRWSFAAARRAYLEGRVHQPRAVMASGPPMSSLIAAAWVARRLRIPLILDFRDPWVHKTPPKPAAKKSLEARFAQFAERWTIRRAAIIFTATAGIAQLLRVRYPPCAHKIFVVRNGFDGEVRPARTSTDHRLEILFAGEIYLGRNPMPFLEGIERLFRQPNVDASKVRVTFVGRFEESMGQVVRQWVRRHNLEHNVRMLAAVPYDDIVRMTADATVLLNLAQQASVMVPAKAYEHIASGREVLLISERDTEVFQLFNDISGVSCVESSDPAQLDANLADLYRRQVILGTSSPPSLEAVKPFSRRAQLEIFRSVLADRLGQSA